MCGGRIFGKAARDSQRRNDYFILPKVSYKRKLEYSNDRSMHQPFGCGLTEGATVIRGRDNLSRRWLMRVALNHKIM